MLNVWKLTLSPEIPSASLKELYSHRHTESTKVASSPLAIRMRQVGKYSSTTTILEWLSAVWMEEISISVWRPVERVSKWISVWWIHTESVSHNKHLVWKYRQPSSTDYTNTAGHPLLKLESNMSLGSTRSFCPSGTRLLVINLHWILQWWIINDEYLAVVYLSYIQNNHNSECMKN